MRISAILGIVVVCGCAVRQPPTVFRPRIDRRLVLGEPGLPQVILEADWRLEGNRYCVSRAPVDVLTPAGPMTLFDADLCATPRPPTISGEATVPLPGLGILASIISGQAPRARLSLARGRDLGALAIGREQLPAEPSHLYLSVDYTGRYQATLARASLVVGGASSRMIVDPGGPVFYFAGDLAGLLSTPITGAVFGLSPTGALPWRSAQPLYDGRGSAHRHIDGHLLIQGTFGLGDLPVSVTGRVFVDLDADDDGQSALGGDAQDVALGGDVNARIDYAIGGFRLAIDIAQASLMLEPSGTAYFSGMVPARLFMGTSLSSFEPATDLAVRAVYHSSTDYAVLLRGDGRLLGLPFSRAQVELGSAGVKLAGRLEVPNLGPVDVAGAVSADGSWAMAGRAPDLTFAGLPLTAVEVSLSPRGTTLSATTSFAGRPFRLTGTVTQGGMVSLTGTIAISSSSRVQLTLDPRGARAAFLGRVCAGAVCLDVPVTEIDTQGNVCPEFPVVGRQCVRVL